MCVTGALHIVCLQCYQTWCLCLKTRTVLTCTRCRRDQSTVYRWKAGDLCARITFMSRRISFHNFVLFSFITQSNKLFVLSNSDTCHSIQTSISYFIHLSTNKLCFMKRVVSTTYDWFMSSVYSYYSTVEHCLKADMFCMSLGVHLYVNRFSCIGFSMKV